MPISSRHVSLSTLLLPCMGRFDGSCFETLRAPILTHIRTRGEALDIQDCALCTPLRLLYNPRIYVYKIYALIHQYHASVVLMASRKLCCPITMQNVPLPKPHSSSQPRLPTHNTVQHRVHVLSRYSNGPHSEQGSRALHRYARDTDSRPRRHPSRDCQYSR